MNFFQEAVETAADHRTGLSASHLRDSARPCAAAVRRSGLVAVTNCDLAVTSPTPPVSPGRRQNNCHQQVPVSSVLLFGSNQGQEDTSAWQCTHTNRERGGGGDTSAEGLLPDHDTRRRGSGHLRRSLRGASSWSCRGSRRSAAARGSARNDDSANPAKWGPAPRHGLP